MGRSWSFQLPPLVCLNRQGSFSEPGLPFGVRGQRMLQTGETAAPEISLCRSVPRPGTQGGRARSRGGRPGKLDDGGEAGGEMGTCPICAGCFSTDLLPVHASTCGEDGSLPDTAWPSPPREDPRREEPPEAWVPCPICEFRFSTAEVERHASTCGEQAGTLETPHSWLWVE
uniref:Uncharacterized protein n=1 Tax=Chrysemys picta bellii TaxID=8478 RepID=A0A8C3H796_CHRPI